MTELLHAEFEDETGTTRRLTREEVLTYVNVVAGAGNETTTRLIGWTGKVLADHPDQRRELVEDRSLIPNAIEELLRYEPPAPHVARYVARDVEHYGQTVPEGSVMMFLVGAANRDDRRFPDGDRFDIHREVGQHLTFGYGIHFCLGAALGPPRGAHRARRGPEAVPRVGRRPRQRAAVAHLHRARVGDAAGRHPVIERRALRDPRRRRGPRRPARPAGADALPRPDRGHRLGVRDPGRLPARARRVLARHVRLARRRRRGSTSSSTSAPASTTSRSTSSTRARPHDGRPPAAARPTAGPARSSSSSTSSRG